MSKSTTEKDIKPIDLVVGSNIREKRTAQGLTLTTLAKKTGLSFQQLQKYEKGTNRVSASTLYAIAEALKASPATFFPIATAEGGAKLEPLNWLQRARTFHVENPCLLNKLMQLTPKQIHVIEALVELLPDLKIAPYGHADYVRDLSKSRSAA